LGSKNYYTIPKLAGKLLTRASGIKVEIDGAEHLNSNKSENPRIFVANHVSSMDIILAQSLSGGAFIAKGEISKWPVIGKLAQAMGTIFVERGKGKEGIPLVHKAVAETLNKRRNVIVFPEGTTTRGDKVLPFKSGVLSVLFNNTSGEALRENVKVQPLAIRLTHVNGKNVDRHPDLRKVFAWGEEKSSFFQSLASIFEAESMKIQIKVLPEMDPKDYRNFKEFTKAAENAVRRGLEAPIQDDDDEFRGFQGDRSGSERSPCLPIDTNTGNIVIA